MSRPAPRLIAIGDIHGEITKLRSLIEQIKPTPEDELVFLGDYIDRGENSVAVLDFLIQKDRAYYPKWTFLMGNHEVMFIEAMQAGMDSKRWAFWWRHGGAETARDYQEHYQGHFSEDHGRFFGRLKAIHNVDEFVFVHAGFDPNQPLIGQLHEPSPWNIWSRDHIKHDLDKWEEGITVVCGHTPQRNGVLIRDKLICVDTGASFTDPKKIKKGYGTLSAIDVRSKRIYRVGPEVMSHA